MSHLLVEASRLPTPTAAKLPRIHSYQWTCARPVRATHRDQSGINHLSKSEWLNKLSSILSESQSVPGIRHRDLTSDELLPNTVLHTCTHGGDLFELVRGWWQQSPLTWPQAFLPKPELPPIYVILPSTARPQCCIHPLAEVGFPHVGPEAHQNEAEVVVFSYFWETSSHIMLTSPGTQHTSTLWVLIKSLRPPNLTASVVTEGLLLVRLLTSALSCLTNHCYLRLRFHVWKFQSPYCVITQAKLPDSGAATYIKTVFCAAGLCETQRRKKQQNYRRHVWSDKRKECATQGNLQISNRKSNENDSRVLEKLSILDFTEYWSDTSGF